MDKIWLGIQGYCACFGWILMETLKWIWEECPDLKFWKPPTHFNDFAWYAERVNGRLAMLVLTTTLVLELVSHKSILEIVYGQ